MNYLFIIQGEGRGHLSQAIAFKEKLEKEGHSILKVFIGRSQERIIPNYAKEQFGTKLNTFRSPNFLKTRDKKGIRPILSIFYNFLLSPVFIYSIFVLRREVRKDEYHRIVNFYDMIGGLAVASSFKKKKTISVSHHYFLETSFFEFPQGFLMNKLFLKLHSGICALRTIEVHALSFDRHLNKENNKLKIIPPLIREEVFNLNSSNDGFILVYLLNSGLMDEINHLALKYSGISFKLFMDISPEPDTIPDNLKYYEINQEGFLKELSNCKALITTAGFESQCEAAFLGKAVFTLPSKNHFEQICNAADGKRAGVSLPIENFDPYSKMNSSENENFRNWCLSGQ